MLIMRKYLHERGRDAARRDPGARLGARHQPGHHQHVGPARWSKCPRTAAATSTWTRCKALIAQHGPKLVGLMLTNPNTLGLFDEHVDEVLRLVHEAGGLVYGDGANFNAILGIAKPGDLGFDVMHYNLHKTFSTPHGGGGPGVGRGGRGGAPGRLPAGADRGAVTRTDDVLPGHMPAKSHRPGEGVLRQLRHPGARLHLHPHARRRGAARR